MADLLTLATEKLGQTVGSGECIVFVADVVQRAYGVWLWGNAIDAGSQSNITALQNAGVMVQRITNRSQLQRGDIVVFTDGGFGHVAIIEEPNQPTVVQQNFKNRRYVTRDSVAWEYYGQAFAYGLRLSKGENEITQKTEGEEEMQAIFSIKEKSPNGIDFGMYWFNGDSVRGIDSQAKLAHLKNIYKLINGRDIKQFSFNKRSEANEFVSLCNATKRTTI